MRTRKTIYQHATSGPTQLEHKIWGNRGFADFATNAIGTKVFTRHSYACSQVDGLVVLASVGVSARKTLSTSAVAATSCTRRIPAPRSAAAIANAKLPGRRSLTRSEERRVGKGRRAERGRR